MSNEFTYYNNSLVAVLCLMNAIEACHYYSASTYVDCTYIYISCEM